ncbi:hypothetical protein F5Y12DRAFT_596575 [Xylaria sp. FL1777]|nr:hypothetical protein F5Y12DRAFT_596575 [Xylaria sp. FL1777]
MPSRLRLNGPTSIKAAKPELTLQPPPTPSSHETLIELSAALTILDVIQPQQESASGNITEDSVFEKFASSSDLSFANNIGVDLPDILWAVALIFSRSRGGEHVVASVLREQPQKEDRTKSFFTLYLTTNARFWSKGDRAYRWKWQNAVNCDANPLDFKSALWMELTRCCSERITGYTEQALKCFEGIRDEDLQGSDAWIREFLEHVKGELGKGPWNEKFVRSLVEDCWDKFPKENGDQFDAWYTRLREEVAPLERRTSSGPVYPDKKLIMLRNLTNLMKVPRAYRIFAKFQNTLVSKGARLEIKLLRGPGVRYSEEIEAAIDKLANEQNHRMSESEVKEAKAKVRWHVQPHCEIQMLQYFPPSVPSPVPSSEREDVWNVMGCSKRPCFACAKILRASGFLFKESHGKAYRQFFLSAEKWLTDDSKMKAAVEELKEKAVKRVREYEPKSTKMDEPDSPLLSDWKFDTLQTLEQTALAAKPVVGEHGVSQT